LVPDLFYFCIYFLDLFFNKLFDDLESIIWTINFKCQVFSWKTEVNIEPLALLYPTKNIVLVYSLISIKKKPIVRLYFNLLWFKQLIDLLGWLTKQFAIIAFNADKYFRTIPKVVWIWVFNSYIRVFKFAIINFIIKIYLKSTKYLLSRYSNGLIVLELDICFSKA
jgi:hypothetical protein